MEPGILDSSARRVGPGGNGAALALLAMIVALASVTTLRVSGRGPDFAACAGEPIDAASGADGGGARMNVMGRVLDPSGKPVSGAAVMVIVRAKQPMRPIFTFAVPPMTDYHGRCDASGGFRIELPRTSSARHDGLVVTALAPGYGMGWADLDPDADPPSADVALRPEQAIHGQVFDMQGQPVPGVTIRTGMLRHALRGDLETVVRRPGYEEWPWRDLPAWPAPAASDDQGRFTLRGLSRGPIWTLFVDDPRYAPASTVILTDDSADGRGLGALQAVIKLAPGPDPKPISITMLPRRTVSGRVTYADTGRSVPHALIGFGILQYQADGEGRFRAAVPGGGAWINRFLVQAQSPGGPPYLIAEKEVQWPKGTVEQSIDLVLKRGVVVRGKVLEEGTGKPVPGAIVRFAPYMLGRGPSYDVSIAAATGTDGSYRVAASPGPGNLVVQAPDDDCVLREFGGYGGPLEAQPGHDRFYAHAFRALDLKPGAADQEVDVSLRRGVAIHGRAVDPEGRPIQQAWIFSRLTLSRGPITGWRTWRLQVDRDRGQVRDGRFALHGLDPDTEVPAYFLEPRRKLGAAARFSGKSAASGPITVRLEPCGTALARLITSEGKPLGRYPASGMVSLIVTPGPPSRPPSPRNELKDGLLFADESILARLDPVNYADDFRSDAAGLLAFPALIPGASYRIVDRTAALGGGEPEVRKEFTVQPGEALHLGDILIARPRARN